MSLTPLESEALLLSLRVACWSVILSLPAGVFFGWLLARKSFWGKTVVDGLIHLPLVVPPVVVGYLLLVVLGRNGAIGGWLHDALGIELVFRWQGAAVASAVMGFPLMVRAIRLSIEAVDPGLEAAARTLGATRLRAFLTITLPLAAPGLITGALLAFARSLGEFGATITFVGSIPGETRTLPLALYNVAQSPGGERAALRLVILSVLLAFAALIVSEILARRARARRGG